MAKNDNLTDFMTDLADTIRWAEIPYNKESTTYDFKTHGITWNENTNKFDWPKNWTLGYLNNNQEFTTYDTRDRGGIAWACSSESVWRYPFGGINLNKLAYGQSIFIEEYWPTIKFICTKTGAIKISYPDSAAAITPGYWAYQIIHKSFTNDTAFINIENLVNYTYTDMNNLLKNKFIRVKENDEILFAARRTQSIDSPINNEKLTLSPIIEYFESDSSSLINPQDFSDRIKNVVLKAEAGA